APASASRDEQNGAATACSTAMTVIPSSGSMVVSHGSHVFRQSGPRPHGSRRAFRAPHHEDIKARRVEGPHPEVPEGGRLEGWPQGTGCCNSDRHFSSVGAGHAENMLGDVG